MAIERIFAKNAAFQKFEVIKTNRNKRYRYGEFLVEGVRNLNEAVQNGWKVSAFLYTREKPLSGWAENLLSTVPADTRYELTSALMAEISGKTDTSELLAIVRMREDTPAFSFQGTPLLALFDRPSNRGNLGTVLRSCDALGVDGLILTGHAVDLYDPEVVVSSMGSFFRVPVIRMPDIATVAEWIAGMRHQYPDFLALGTTAHAAHTLDEVNMTVPLLLMLGNETDGLSLSLRELCDDMTTIPMDTRSSASSLNVACAATALFYEARRQRRKA